MYSCSIFGIDNMLTTTYNPQCNGQTEVFNCTLLSSLRHYVVDHPRDWDSFSYTVTYAYNTQTHRLMNIAHFELVLSKRPAALCVQR